MPNRTVVDGEKAVATPDLVFLAAEALASAEVVVAPTRYILVPHPDPPVARDVAIERRARRHVLLLWILRVGLDLFERAPVTGIMMVRFPNACSAPRNPRSGAAFSSLIMRGIASATGHHWCTRHRLFTRMPITNMQTSPSAAVMRCLMMGIGVILVRQVLTIVWSDA
jgi:hypothetical protein